MDGIGACVSASETGMMSFIRGNYACRLRMDIQ